MSVTVAVALLVASVAAPAQSVYKWTDAQGSVHYTDQPPPAGRTASTIKIKADAAAATPAPTTATAVKAGEPASGALAQAEAAARKRNCERAKANLATLSSGALLVDGSDPANAKRLDAGQRESETRTAQTDVSNYCDGGGR
jgi:hypothetical protein